MDAEAHGMSYQAVKLVLERSQASRSDRLVLLVLAERMNAKFECWPGVEDIARRARLTEDQVRRILRKLERAGELRILTGGGVRSGGKGRTSTYTLTLSRATPAPAPGLPLKEPRRRSRKYPCAGAGNTPAPAPGAPATNQHLNQKQQGQRASNPVAGSRPDSAAAVAPGPSEEVLAMLADAGIENPKRTQLAFGLQPVAPDVIRRKLATLRAQGKPVGVMIRSLEDLPEQERLKAVHRPNGSRGGGRVAQPIIVHRKPAGPEAENIALAIEAMQASGSLEDYRQRALANGPKDRVDYWRRSDPLDPNAKGLRSAMAGEWRKDHEPSTVPAGGEA